MSDTNAKAATPELVTLTVDGKKVSVPKGTNLIEAAKSAGIDVPYYCYHPHLSIAGNCRMCKVSVKGAPKMDIGCNTSVREGMEVETHHTNKAVADTQAATLEFILVNHPLDCTVCDQAGHCKLQDYHYEYNAKSSRFLEEKEHKVKATPLGPTVMLDGERCIMCTRCIRFCDEITKTSELGMLNRGDRSVIAVSPDRPLDNPLSGTVVDLCPVGALTHREWRFNTRIWFTKETESICPGCSTGCNVKVASRDGQIVQVKARLNSEVNKEWMCDEGRYGFHRFLPEKRITGATVKGATSTIDAAVRSASALKGGDTTVVFVDPHLTTEEFVTIKKFVSESLPGSVIAVQFRSRSLTATEKILISPDYAGNIRGAAFAGIGDASDQGYAAALAKVRKGEAQHLLFFGDRSVLVADCDGQFVAGVKKAASSCAVLTDASHPLASAAAIVLPGRSILEKSGMFVNKDDRLQWIEKVVKAQEGTESDARFVGLIAKARGVSSGGMVPDRDLSLAILNEDERLRGITIAMVKAGGISLRAPRDLSRGESSASVSR